MRYQSLLTLFLLALGLGCLVETPRLAAQEAKTSEGEAEEFATADGVLLRGRFHPTQKGSPGSEPTVIMMYSPGPDKDMTKGNWAEMANTLNKEGFNVFRFDWRGHGNSKTIQDPNKFWNVPAQGQPYTNPFTGPIHQSSRYLKGFNKLKLKQDISVRDFGPGYTPVLVNDLAAVRVHLDQKNDRGAANTSRIYLMAEGEAATIAMIWMCTEWYRHDTDVLKGQVGISYNVVPPPPLIMALKPIQVRAGETIRGAVWLSPKLANGVTQGQLTQLFDPNKQPGLRQTPMLFMYGKDDTAGKNTAINYFFNTVVKAQPHPSSSLIAVKNTLAAEIPGKLVGAAMLGNSNGVAEERIVKYMRDILPNTKAEVKQREFTFPYFVDLSLFGFRF